MTVALSDIVVLRDLLRPLCNLNDAAALCKYLEAFYTLRKVSNEPNKTWFHKELLSFMYLQFPYSLFAASGIHHKHIGRGPLQGLLCVTRSSEEGNATGVFRLFESWGHLL